jgi:hypothetical protein
MAVLICDDSVDVVQDIGWKFWHGMSLAKELAQGF